MARSFALTGLFLAGALVCASQGGALAQSPADPRSSLDGSHRRIEHPLSEKLDKSGG